VARDRAVAVCWAGDAVLVVRRWRDGRAYTVLPGGGVADGETPAAAVLRELAEETGLTGVLVRRLGAVEHADRTAHYFLVGVEPGPLVLGGPEARAASAVNRYAPGWLPLADLDAEPLVPAGVRAIIRAAAGRPAAG
jgi:8-oxo-dGTP diphosphatase